MQKKKMIKGVKKLNFSHWIIKQRKDIEKIFAPNIDYNEEYDTLWITWFPQLKVKYSLESSDDIIFDISEQEEVKGIEIMDFKKRFLKNANPKSNKKKRR
jgi:uncharacterized protein YuzE